MRLLQISTLSSKIPSRGCIEFRIGKPLLKILSHIEKNQKTMFELTAQKRNAWKFARVVLACTYAYSAQLSNLSTIISWLAFILK